MKLILMEVFLQNQWGTYEKQKKSLIRNDVGLTLSGQPIRYVIQAEYPQTWGEINTRCIYI